MQKHAVQYFPGRWREPERDIADPKRGVHARQCLLYQRQPSQGLYGGLSINFFASRQGESQVIKDQVLGFQAAFPHSQVVNPLSHLQLTFGGLSHALLVNGQRENGGAVLFCQRKHASRFFGAGLQVCRVDQAAARSSAQSGFYHVRFSGVDNQRNGRFQRKALH